MTTKKQIEANRKNAQKSTGPVTAEGKEIAKLNAVQHAIMTDAVIVREGDGQESEDAYRMIVSGLKEYFEPEGAMEYALVEQVAIALWRKRRVLRFETGCIRSQLDNYLAEYQKRDSYGDKTAFQNLSDAKAKHKTFTEAAAYLKDNPDQDPTAKEFVNDWCDNYFKVAKARDWESQDPHEILGWLLEEGLSKKKILDELMEVDEKAAKEAALEIEALKGLVQLELQREALKGSLPSTPDMEKIIRYEAALDRQVYKAINQLERLQRRRKGEDLPAPIVLEGA